jgi:hypothetical protein
MRATHGETSGLIDERHHSSTRLPRYRDLQLTADRDHGAALYLLMAWHRSCPAFAFPDVVSRAVACEVGAVLSKPALEVSAAHSVIQ